MLFSVAPGAGAAIASVGAVESGTDAPARNATIWMIQLPELSGAVAL